MKKIILYFILVLLLSPLLAFAQSADQPKTSFALLGGINFQNLNGKDFNGDKLENNLMIGYHAGINIQIPIAPEFYFQPGLLFTTKGAKHTEGSLTTTYRLSYIEMPLNVVYKAILGKGKFMLGAGPYVGYGIGSKVLTEGGYFKAFDAGGNIFAGYELSNGVFFQLNTQLGMLKINPEVPNDKSSVKNTGFGFSVGYRF